MVALAAAGAPAFEQAPSRAAGLPREAVVSPPPPEHRADRGLETYLYRVGPYALGPYDVLRRTDAVKPPPVAGSIVGMDVRVLDPAGHPIPQYVTMLHHLVFTNGGPDGRRRDGACPGRPVNERFFGTSEELRPMTLPPGYGYPTAPSDRWKMIWMLMNHRAQPREAYIEYRVTVDPSPGLTPVKPYWLSVVPCVSDPQYTVPGGLRRGASQSRSTVFRMPVSGRIVAVGGHLHGGGRRLVLSQPGCGNRPLFVSKPTYAPPGDPLYRVEPLLHEPDPKDMSWFQSRTGWAVRQGDPLRVSAEYGGHRPHMRVMGIAHVYVAPDPEPRPPCAPSPTDAQMLGPDFAGRPSPPGVNITLAGYDGRGVAHPIGGPRGRFRRLRGSARVLVRSFSFAPPNLSIPRGASVRWTFKSAVQHDATLARGPRGFAAPYSRRGDSFRRRFEVPGEYRIYCSLHPVYMSQVVRVRRR
jgi:hypothetical protein